MLARVCGEMRAMMCVGAVGESRVVRTSVWDWRETRTASAEVTQPEQARQSVSEIWAGGRSGALSSRMTS